MDDSRMGGIVLFFNPHQEGMTTADTIGLMVSNALGRRFFSYTVLQRKLQALLAEIVGVSQ